MQKYKSNITTTSGAAVRGVPVLVIDEGGNNAALFLDRAGTVPAQNPLTTGPDGVFYFYAVNGRYSLRTTVDGVTITDDDVVLMMDPEEITVAGPIAEAVVAAQAAAIAAEFSVEASGIPDLVAAAQNAVVDSNNAVTQATSAANNAAISKTGADSARDAAVIAQNAAEAALDSFDDRYLGAKASAPATDNDGGALLTGALYWDTALPGMRSWNGSVWVTLPAATKASVGLANVDNTSDAAKSVLSATKLTTARTINGVSFDGSANININADAISNTPAGSIAATTVQGAINELAEIKVDLAAAMGASLVGFQQEGTGAVPTTVQSKLRASVSVKDFGAVCDGVADDSAALFAANARAVEAGLPLLIPGVMKINSATTIRALIVDTLGQIFTPASSVVIDNGQPIRPEWWGADPTNSTDSLAAWNACAVAAKGREVRISGMYKLSNTLTVDYNDEAGLKIVGGGAHLLTAPGLAHNKFGFNFDTIPAGQNGLDIQRVRGLVLEDFFVSHRVGSGAGVSVHLRGLDNFRIANVCIDTNNGAGSSGFRFGLTNGVDCAFMGNVQNCKVISNGQMSFDVRPVCTSLNFANCYQIGGFNSIDGATYCNFTSCASESAPQFGYALVGCSDITFLNCAGEANGRGVFYLQTGCSNINFINPYGAGNNTTGAAVGDLITIDGSAGGNASISITNPAALSSHVSTPANIYAIGTNGAVEVNNVYSGALAKGVDGPVTWKQNSLTVTGDGEVRSFTPTLNAGWTNVGTPTLTGKYCRKGKVVHFWIDIAPGTSIKSNGASSQIVIPWAASVVATAGVTDGNALGYVSAVVGVAGSIYVPPTAVLTVPLSLSGTIITT